jgi:hypothetical protein
LHQPREASPAALTLALGRIIVDPDLDPDASRNNDNPFRQ